jgi:hypothetical protein
MLHLPFGPTGPGDGHADPVAETGRLASNYYALVFDLPLHGVLLSRSLAGLQPVWTVSLVPRWNLSQEEMKWTDD